MRDGNPMIRNYPVKGKGVVSLPMRDGNITVKDVLPIGAELLAYL